MVIPNTFIYNMLLVDYCIYSYYVVFLKALQKCSGCMVQQWYQISLLLWDTVKLNDYCTYVSWHLPQAPADSFKVYHMICIREVFGMQMKKSKA